MSQISPEVYRRADDLAKKTSDKVYYGNVGPIWIGKTNSFLYENFTPEGTEYLIVNADKLTKRKHSTRRNLLPHLKQLPVKRAEPGKLPIRNILFSDKLGSFAFTYDGYNWICNLRDYRYYKTGKGN